MQEQTQSFPRLKIKPVYRSFYEFKSKLNRFHGSRSNRYNCLKSYTNTPQLSEVIDLQFSHNTIDLSQEYDKQEIELEALERATMEAFKQKF